MVQVWAQDAENLRKMQLLFIFPCYPVENEEKISAPVKYLGSHVKKTHEVFHFYEPFILDI